MREDPLPHTQQDLSIERDGDRTRLRFHVDKLRTGRTLHLVPPLSDDLGRYISIHLEDLNFVEPFGLIYLFWYLRWIGGRASDLQVVLPQNRDILTYLKRMHLPESVDDMHQVSFIPRIDSWMISEADLPGQLVELEIFEVSDDDAVYELAGKTVEIILSRDRDVRVSNELLHLTLTEVISNIEVHSGTRIGALAVQRYGDRVHMAFGDGGVGIPSALRSAGLEGTDRELVEEALREHVTSRRGGGGMGLTDLAHAVRRAGSHMDVRSGQGHVRIGRGGFSRDDCGALPGTMIEVVW